MPEPYKVQLSDSEKKLADRVILELRTILSKTGHGKILIHCEKRNGKQTTEISGQLYTKTLIEF